MTPAAPPSCLPEDRGLGVSRTVLRRQLTAMPCGLYQVRLIHSGSHQPYPGVRRWTASQLLDSASVRFLRIRNRQGYDVYLRPYAGDQNAGYILLDLDRPLPGILAGLRAQGHAPSVVVETSPQRLQAWIRVSGQPLPPALATRIAQRLTQLYAADLVSADGRRLGRLAGFTNRKPQRQRDGQSGSLGETALCSRLPGWQPRGLAGTRRCRTARRCEVLGPAGPAAYPRHGFPYRPRCHRVANSVSGLPDSVTHSGALSVPRLEHRR
jgi:hypothetical protein